MVNMAHEALSWIMSGTLTFEEMMETPTLTLF